MYARLSLNREASNLDEQQIEQKIQDKGLNAPRVTPDQINALMSQVSYVTEQRPGDTNTTFVHAFLHGQFHLATGMSACVDPANFDEAVGIDIASRKAAALARDKLWELEGYRLYTNQKAST